MLTEQLLAYVRENTNAGFKRADIEAALKASGWDALDIAAAFTAVSGAPAPQPILTAPSAAQLSDQNVITTEVSRFKAQAKQFSKLKVQEKGGTGIIGFLLRHNLASSKQMANIVLIICTLLLVALAVGIVWG